MRYFSVAVDQLSCYFWVHSMRTRIIWPGRTLFMLSSHGTCAKRSSLAFAAKQFNGEKFGRIFASNFANCCNKNFIAIYLTFSETKSAFVGRTIRFLKNFVFKLLHEVDRLAEFVAIINTRVNLMTQLAPEMVDQSNILYLISLCRTNYKQKPKFKLVDCL